MIQRIQSFYLLIVTGLLITAMCLPMGYFIDTTGEHPFKALGIDVNGIFQSTWGDIWHSDAERSGSFCDYFSV